MCGIAGLFSKSSGIEEDLGSHLGAMLAQLATRGPDSAGVAFYRDPAPAGARKVSLYSPDEDYSWETLAGSWQRSSGCSASPSCEPRTRCSWSRETRPRSGPGCTHHHPEIRVMSVGERIEIYKEAGDPREFVERFDLAGISATHALGHTRMATESRVTTEHSHPFSTGPRPLPGSQRLPLQPQPPAGTTAPRGDRVPDRQRLRGRRRLSDLAPGRRASLEQALSGCLDDLDGFYTFAVGTADGFAVLRDPIACKPAVMAETDDWVAMASEYRAIAELPGADRARLWEPEPAQVYSWQRAKVS